MARRHNFENDGYDEFTAYVCVCVCDCPPPFERCVLLRNLHLQGRQDANEAMVWWRMGGLIIRWFILFLESLFVDVIMSYGMVFQFCD